MVKDLRDKHALYYEAILQLRDVTEEMLNYAENEINRIGMRIAKVEEHRNGIDYYLSDMHSTRMIGKRMQEKYGGDYKVTTSLFGKKKDKELYRLTVLFRGFAFKKGESLRYKGEDYKILSVGDRVILQNLQNGKKIRLKYDEMEKFKKIE